MVGVKKSGAIVATLTSLAVAGSLMATAAPQALASSKGTLVLYSAQGYDQAMATAFQKATGITVKLTDDSTGPLIARAEAEGGNPHWDVIWFDGDSSMQAMDNQGLLLRNWTPNDYNNLNGLGKQLVAKDSSYFPTGVTGMGAIGYDPKVVAKSDLPKSLSDLLSPKWQGAVAMNDPAISGPTYPLVAGVLQQEGSVKAGESFFSKLKANGLHVYATNKVTIGNMLAGKAKLAIVQDSALISDQVSGDPIAIDYLTTGTYSLPSVMAIDKNAPDMANAKKFVEWVLTYRAQQVQINVNNGGGDSYYMPVVKWVKPDAPALRPGVKWVKVNPITAAQEKNAVETWFHDHITL